MSTWILILALVSTSNTGSSIHSVPGFRDQAACMAAASAWQASVRPYAASTAIANCVEQKR